RIQARLKFSEQTDEFQRGELHVWKSEQEIDDFAALEEVSLLTCRDWLRESLEARVARPFGHGLEKWVWYSRDFVMPQQRRAQGTLLPVHPGNDFLTTQAEGPNEFFNQVRTIRGHDAEGIPDLVSQVRAIESDLKMTGLSGRSRAIEVEVGPEAGGE